MHASEAIMWRRPWLCLLAPALKASPINSFKPGVKAALCGAVLVSLVRLGGQACPLRGPSSNCTSSTTQRSRAVA